MGVVAKVQGLAWRLAITCAGLLIPPLLILPTTPEWSHLTASVLYAPVLYVMNWLFPIGCTTGSGAAASLWWSYSRAAFLCIPFYVAFLYFITGMAGAFRAFLSSELRTVIARASQEGLS